MSTELPLSEQEAIRRQSLEQIRAAGIDPYPADLYPVNAAAKDILAQFTDESAGIWTEICLAGRLMSKRIHSIFVLRLFNDCIASLIAHAAVLALSYFKMKTAATLLSFGVSVKMNVSGLI